MNTVVYRIYVSYPDNLVNKFGGIDNLRQMIVESASLKFGGATVYDAKGGWVDKDVFYYDNTFIIEIILFSSSKYSFNDIKEYANRLRKYFKQKSVLITKNAVSVISIDGE